MTRRVIVSDLHFGDPTCSLQVKAVRDGLRSFLRGLGHVHELILAGDVLDANISSFTAALFGSPATAEQPPQIGLRDWWAHLLRGDGLRVDRILYIPGNHDYKVWDLLCTYDNFLRPVAMGRRPDPAKVPQREGRFRDCFLRGLLPATFRGALEVVFPDHTFTLGSRRVLVTHGHYLDKKQTMGKTIHKLLLAHAREPAAARRLFFQYAALYQAIAHAMSYTRWTRETTDWAHKKASGLVDAIVGSIRDEPINSAQLRAVEDYLAGYRSTRADIFIFGHTHEAGRRPTDAFGRTAKKRRVKQVIDVWNTGCFLQRRGKLAGSLLLVDDEQADDDRVQLIRFDRHGATL